MWFICLTKIKNICARLLYLSHKTCSPPYPYPIQSIHTSWHSHPTPTSRQTHDVKPLALWTTRSGRVIPFWQILYSITTPNPNNNIYRIWNAKYPTGNIKTKQEEVIRKFFTAINKGIIMVIHYSHAGKCVLYLNTNHKSKSVEW